MSALGDVTGSRVVVTGGGGGLGSAVAAELCRLGARVLVCGRTSSCSASRSSAQPSSGLSARPSTVAPLASVSVSIDW